MNLLSGIRRQRAARLAALALAATGGSGLPTAPAHAAGGAHIIDDAAVETPGVCHLESWVTRQSNGSGLLNLGPACTLRAIPFIEFGAAGQQTWNPAATVLGPTLKFTLRPVETGVGLGLIAAATFNGSGGRTETASLIVPVSIRLHDWLRANINAGWQYQRGQQAPNRAFAGAQFEIDVRRDLMLMTEMFARNRGAPGAQAGLRWTPGRGNISVDLLSGWKTDGTSPLSLTFGLTIRH